MKRRNMVAGLGVLLAAGGAAWRFDLFGRHYPSTPYDDLLDQITDREPAAVFGKAALSTMPGMTAAGLAGELRRERIALGIRATREPGENQVAEVEGWVVPRGVALYAALAASV